MAMNLRSLHDPSVTRTWTYFCIEGQVFVEVDDSHPHYIECEAIERTMHEVVGVRVSPNGIRVILEGFTGSIAIEACHYEFNYKGMLEIMEEHDSKFHRMTESGDGPQWWRENESIVAELYLARFGY